MKLLDAFCGAGGAAVGYHLAGFDVVGVDITRQHSYPYRFVRADALEILTVAPFMRDFVAVHCSPPCFPAGTPVVTAGGVVPIETVGAGDLVLTHQSRWRRVESTMSREAEVVSDGWCATTADHRFYAREQTGRRELGDPTWAPASEIKGMFVAVPSAAEPLVMPHLPGREIDRGPSFWYMVGRWLGDGWVRIKELEKREPRAKSPASRVPVACRQCGESTPNNKKWPHLWNLYCSKACRMKWSQRGLPERRSEVMICCAREEADGLASKLAGTGLVWRRSEMRTATRFATYHVGLAEWLVTNFGRYSHGKTLPGWLFGVPRSVREALLDGYVDSDGSLRQGGWRFTTVSPCLAIGTRILAAGLGYDTSLVLNQPNRIAQIEGRTVNERPQWQLSLSYNRYGHVGEKHWWGKRRTEFVHRGIETVYDLTVEEDHSFVAWGFVVHNCQGYSTQTADRSHHARLIGDVRARLQHLGLPYIIENVEGASTELIDPIRLCGSAFGLDLRRHRYFETNWPCVGAPCNHHWQLPRFRSLDMNQVRLGRKASVVGVHGKLNYPGERPLRAAAMGIDWMSDTELVEAIPPAYTTFLGRQLHAHVRASAGLPA